MRAIHCTALLFMLPALLHGQRLSPDEAVAVLRASHSVADLTNAHFGDGPRVFVMNSSPTAGPFGEFKPFAPTEPLSRGLYFFRVPAYCHGCD